VPLSPSFCQRPTLGFVLVGAFIGSRKPNLGDYPNWQCFHKDMITSEKIAKLTEQSMELQQEFAGLTARFDTIWESSSIKNKNKNLFIKRYLKPQLE
jgi:hypothetical protein